MIKAKRIGHATFETPDLDRQIDYYEHVVGLRVAGARRRPRVPRPPTPASSRSCCAKAAEQRCSRIAFEVSPELSFDDMAQAPVGGRAQERGPQRLAARHLQDAGVHRHRRARTIELFSDWSFLPTNGPPPSGIGPNKLGHLAWVCNDPQAVADFYVKVLGFRVSDWIGDYFGFLRCGVDHHTVNFIRGPQQRMHHFAFELRDPGHLHNACDLLGQKKIEIVWGPVRHGPGHNVATYHRNPDDQMVEFFIELDKMLDEELGYFEPRPWHGDRPQKPKVWEPEPAARQVGPAARAELGAAEQVAGLCGSVVQPLPRERVASA